MDVCVPSGSAAMITGTASRISRICSQVQSTMLMYYRSRRQLDQRTASGPLREGLARNVVGLVRPRPVSPRKTSRVQPAHGHLGDLDERGPVAKARRRTVGEPCYPSAAL